MKTKHYDNSSEAVKKWKAELRERVRATNEEKAAELLEPTKPEGKGE